MLFWGLLWEGRGVTAVPSILLQEYHPGWRMENRAWDWSRRLRTVVGIDYTRRASARHARGTEQPDSIWLPTTGRNNGNRANLHRCTCPEWLSCKPYRYWCSLREEKLRPAQPDRNRLRRHACVQANFWFVAEVKVDGNLQAAYVESRHVCWGYMFSGAQHAQMKVLSPPTDQKSSLSLHDTRQSNYDWCLPDSRSSFTEESSHRTMPTRQPISNKYAIYLLAGSCCGVPPVALQYLPL